uniref:Uncharacterized protein n=1 Tax=Palpitomonas bilix TaxID=652834 RepID=A0A7S3CUU9_9EUKA|mmetsp:Transcript_10328/g.27083  ORF Transcript_10328/g.27083 Transcript_10328/m.27083 type:complete len:141 (+) Transcript_10328:103-525(+)
MCSVLCALHFCILYSLPHFLVHFLIVLFCATLLLCNLLLRSAHVLHLHISKQVPGVRGKRVRVLAYQLARFPNNSARKKAVMCSASQHCRNSSIPALHTSARSPAMFGASVLSTTLYECYVALIAHLHTAHRTPRTKQGK